MSTTGQTAIDIINRSHHRRDADPLLDLMADDAQYVQYDKDHPPSAPMTLDGREDIEVMIREVFARDMTHQVVAEVVSDDRLAYIVECEYPSGERVTSAYVCDLVDGRITRMVAHTSWDG
jgi:ketosteroid isomerase-like protein